MELKPVKRYAAPPFPTRSILDAHPELLRLAPKRWQGNVVVLSALTTACLLMAGYHAQRAEARPSKTPSRTTPLLSHSKGRSGSYGGVFASPFFLPEEEARQVIVDKAKLTGIQLILDRLNQKDVKVPVSNQFGFPDREDFSAREKHEAVYCTASGFIIRDVTSALHDELSKTEPAESIAILNDPVVGLSPVAMEEERIPFTKEALAPLSLFSRWHEIKVTYHEKEKTVSMVGKHTLVLSIDSDTATVDGNKVNMPCIVMLRYKTPYLPLSFVVKELGGMVKCKEENTVVSIIFPDSNNECTSYLQQLTINEQQVTVAFANFDEKSREIMANNTAREELRKQVKGFITWLKAQGVM